VNREVLIDVDCFFRPIRMRENHQRRESEKDGKDYYFVTEDEFKLKIQNRDFVEWAQVHGYYYGTSFHELKKMESKKKLILDVDIQGARQIKNYDPKALLIFIFPPEFQELKKRLLLRGDETQESIDLRLSVAKKEILSYHNFDFLIINDRLEEAADNLISLVGSSGSFTPIHQKRIDTILKSFSGERHGGS